MFLNVALNSIADGAAQGMTNISMAMIEYFSFVPEGSPYSLGDDDRSQRRIGPPLRALPVVIISRGLHPNDRCQSFSQSGQGP